jgi:hypothetical protein
MLRCGFLLWFLRSHHLCIAVVDAVVECTACALFSLVRLDHSRRHQANIHASASALLTHVCLLLHFGRIVPHFPGGEATAMFADGADAVDVARLVVTVERDIGPILFVNYNVGAQMGNRSLDKTSYKAFELAWRLGSLGAFSVAKVSPSSSSSSSSPATHTATCLYCALTS